MLDRQLTYLYGMTTTADQKPGRDALQRFEDIEKILRQEIEKFRQILNKDIPELNKKLESEGVPPVKIDSGKMGSGT